MPKLFPDFGVVSQVELGANEYNGYARCMMLDLRIPLCYRVSEQSRIRERMTRLTFALTLSKDDGLTIEKHMRKTSVCGYDKGRSRS